MDKNKLDLTFVFEIVEHRLELEKFTGWRFPKESMTFITEDHAFFTAQYFNKNAKTPTIDTNVSLWRDEDADGDNRYFAEVAIDDALDLSTITNALEFAGWRPQNGCYVYQVGGSILSEVMKTTLDKFRKVYQTVESLGSHIQRADENIRATK